MSDQIPTCDACRPDAPKVTDAQAQLFLQQLDGWSISDYNHIPVLVKRYTFKDFKQALHFTNEVGCIAEEVNHHPEIVTEWGGVTVRWWTHKINGLHEMDFAMAKRCDSLAA